MKLEPLPPIIYPYCIPQRLVQYQPHQFILWTFMQRKVFALVDGKRTVLQIAQLLSTSLSKVTKTLHELQAMQMVTL